MRSKSLKIKADIICWAQFTRHSDAIFLSLGREIRIGVLSVSTLLTAAPSSAVGKIAMTPIDYDKTHEICIDGSQEDTSPFDMTLLEEGDLLFNVVSQKDGLTEAIVNVTEGINHQSISHVAIVHKQKEKIFALEASDKHGVWLNPIDSFIKEADYTLEGKPMIIIGRLKNKENIKASIEKALSYLGRPYDKLYMPDEKEIYCSELVQLSFTYRDGNYVFSQIPMSFHDETGNITIFWKEYYKKYNMEVPEGKLGTNPGEISRSNAIEIIHKLY